MRYYNSGTEFSVAQGPRVNLIDARGPGACLFICTRYNERWRLDQASNRGCLDIFEVSLASGIFAFERRFKIDGIN